jgi:transcriptional antiterminator RfaH
MDDLRWYAVQTKPRQEERVRYWLRERSGLPVFLPRIQGVRRRRTRRVTVVEPLFPSYLFVEMRLDPDPWYAVKWTPGVRRIVATGDVPTPVPVEVIRLLQARCEGDEVIPWRPSLRAGAAVQVVHGPFAGLQGILDRPSSRGERVRVLLQLMGCATSVEMDIADVELVA